MEPNISEIYVFIITAIILFGAISFFLVYFIITYYRKQQKNEQEKQVLQAQFNEDLLNSKIEIQEKTFDDISRELHDNIGQQLSAASIYLNLAIKNFDAMSEAKLVECRNIVTNSLQDLRQITQTLLGEKISDTGLLQSVKLEIAKINKLGICNVVLDCNVEYISLDPKKEIILFRIIQEVISNAVKHAPGCQIQINIHQVEDNLKIQISDNGPGFAQNKINAGIGLLNIKSRAQTIGANYRLNSREGLGTKIQLDILKS